MLYNCLSNITTSFSYSCCFSIHLFIQPQSFSFFPTIFFGWLATYCYDQIHSWKVIIVMVFLFDFFTLTTHVHWGVKVGNWWIVRATKRNAQVMSALEPSGYSSRAYPGFCSIKYPGVFLFPPGWDDSLLQGYPPSISQDLPNSLPVLI